MRAPRLSIGLGSFLVALALVVAVGVGSAIAVIPNNGTYSACLTKATGEIRVVNYPKVKCVKGERLIRWSQRGPAGTQGVQGPAGPADWGAIPNIPAGFADGVDNVGYISEVQPGTYTAELGFTTAVKVVHPIGTDVDLTIIPALGKNVEVLGAYFLHQPDGLLSYELKVTNSDFMDPVIFKVRTRIYNTGIAPAAFKKALKKVEVTVVKAPRKRR